MAHHIHQPSNPGENEAGSVLALTAIGVPLFEDDPKHPGRKRVKRTDGDKGEIVYTPESLAQYEAYKAEAASAADPIGAGACEDNPVLTFYRVELAYQRDPSKVRPLAGPYKAKNEIPKDVLKQLERDAAPSKAR